MISKQPFFIAGIEDEAVAKSSAFGAMGMFLFTFCASIFGIWYDSSKKVTADETEATYQLATDIMPKYGTSS